MNHIWGKRTLFFLVVLAAVLVGRKVRPQLAPVGDVTSGPLRELTKEKIAAAMDSPLNQNQFPMEIDIPVGQKREHVQVEYTLDSEAQNHIEKLFASYRPDYGAFVAVDAQTGRILSMVSYTREPSKLGNLALRATFPAASVFKIVTAAAALDQHKATPDTVITFQGANHTLYRRNVTNESHNRWTRRMTLSDAFAQSINTVFAKVGVFLLNPWLLEEYARRFRFNESMASDVPVQAGTFALPENDQWAVAEAASGFNRVATMSPIQGAMIAAAVANDGVMMEPFVVSSLVSAGGAVLYHSQPKEASVTMTAESASELRTLMRETVTKGTSRKAFRSAFRKGTYSDLEIGGKTGHLTGLSPKGRCDWFVGYVRTPVKRIALAALTVNEVNWRVKSSFLARYFIDDYFAPSSR